MKGFFQPQCGKSQSQLEIALEEINCDKFSVFWLEPRNRRFSLFSAFTVTTQTLLLGSAHLPAASLTLQMPLSSSQDSFN